MAASTTSTTSRTAPKTKRTHKQGPQYAYPPALMGVEQVAYYLGISVPAVRQWYPIGRIPAPVALGARKLWRRSDLDEWVAQQQQVLLDGVPASSLYSGLFDR